jgi:hypothetical protein
MTASKPEVSACLGRLVSLVDLTVLERRFDHPQDTGADGVPVLHGPDEILLQLLD